MQLTQSICSVGECKTLFFCRTVTALTVLAVLLLADLFFNSAAFCKASGGTVTETGRIIFPVILDESLSGSE